MKKNIYRRYRDDQLELADIAIFAIFALGVISFILLGLAWFIRIFMGPGGDIMLLLYFTPLYLLAPLGFLLSGHRRVRFVIENKLPFLNF